MSILPRLKTYYHLAKPERTYANVLTTTAGFLLASKWHVSFWLLVSTLLGTSFVIASACVLNNYFDRKIDAKMPRTSNRALVKGQVKPLRALIFALILGLIGFAILVAYVNKLVVILGAIAYLDYVVLYGLAKRHTVHSTLIGTVAGAMPIAAGYCAVTDRIDSGAVLIYLIMTFWQMPHFYAIAIYRLKDYAAGGLPVLPVKKGIAITKKQIILYMLAFTVTAILPTIFGYSGIIYFIVVLAAALAWLRVGLRGFKTKDDTRWAKETFIFSLIVLLVFVFMLAVDPHLS
jgi:protoheme IX farnesyltransferase